MADLEIQHGAAQVDGLRIAHQTSGAGPVLICGHAMGWDHRLWDPHRGAFSARHRLVTFDQRGAGGSDHPMDLERYSVEGFGDDLKAVLDDLGVERAAILGYSMGAISAISFASRWPERVEKLVLVSAMASRLPEEIIQRAGIVAEMVHQKGLLETYRFYFDGPLFAGAPKTPEHRRRIDAAAAAATPHGFLGCFRVAIDRPSQLEALKRITAPSLVMVGENDLHYVPEAERIAARLPDARVTLLKGVGHALCVEDPVAFENAVLGFLDGP